MLKLKFAIYKGFFLLSMQSTLTQKVKLRSSVTFVSAYLSEGTVPGSYSLSRLLPSSGPR